MIGHFKYKITFNVDFSFGLGIWMAFYPQGFKVQGVLLQPDATNGNINFFKCAEGYLESYPQSVYQLSLVFRTGKFLFLKSHLSYLRLVFIFILKNCLAHLSF